MSNCIVKRTENFTEMTVGKFTVQAMAWADPVHLAQMVLDLKERAPSDGIPVGGVNYGMGHNGTDHYFVNEQLGISVRWWEPAAA